MKKTRTFFVALMACVCALPVFSAGPTATLVANRRKASQSVVPGVWHAGFSKCKAYAEANKVPMIAVWSNGDACGHCYMFEQSVNHKYFKNWMKDSGMVFYFIHSGDGGDGAVGSKVFHWCRNNKNTAYPFVRIYWPAGKVDIATVGDTVDGSKANEAGAKKAVAYFQSKLKKFKPTPATPKYNGGDFGVPDAEQGRLEAEIGFTTDVTLPLVRTNLVSATYAYTNSVVAKYPNGTVSTNVVEWKSGDDEASISYPVSSLTHAGDKIELVLLNAQNKPVATNHITAVNAVPNSPKNPYWIGERTKDTLDWGEWTMDLDAATNKVKAFNVASSLSAGGGDRAYTMVLVGGSMWCPDCAAADHNCFERQEFKDWAKSKKAALVVIDIPNLPSGTASLLSYVTSKTSNRYITCNYTPGYSNEAMRVQSGAGYISRHMISPEAAAEIAERNAWLVGHNTLEGGWNRPERTNQDRTGVPMLIVLRDDGTIAARFNRFSDVGPNAWSDGYLKRFDEMLDQVAEPAEEANDASATTTETIGLRTKVEGRTISFSDAQDVYRLDPEATPGQRMKFTLSGDKSVQMELKLLAPDGVAVCTTNGILRNSLTLDYEIPSTNYYISVGYEKSAGYPVSAHFTHTSPLSTLSGYTLATDFVAVPHETKRVAPVAEGTGEIAMALSSNVVYRITGLDAAANAEMLVPVEGAADRYTSIVDGVWQLKFTTTEAEYQIWNPGKVGFAQVSAFAAESAGVATLRLVRTGGLSGTATASVAFNAEKSSKLTDLLGLPDDLGSTLTWEEGEDDVKTIEIEVKDNPFADGDQIFYFDATCGGDAATGVAQLKLTLRDNDKAVAGKLAIAAADPSFAADMTVYARAGDDVEVLLAREDGADGIVSGTLATSMGSLSETSFRWEGRDTAAKSSVLSLAGVAAGKKVAVKLTPAIGTKVDAKRRTLMVYALDPSVPGFAENARRVACTRYVPAEEVTIALDDKGQSASKPVIKKHSGKLVPGLSWSQQEVGGKVCLVIKGRPTAAGVFTAVFRAYDGKTAGLTTAVTFDVVDPVNAGGGVSGTEPLNASVAKGRTFADVPVWSGGELAGVMTLTLPRTGRASAKYRAADGRVVTLTCQGWSAIDGEGALSAELAGTCEGEEYSLAVTALPDGGVAAVFTDPVDSGAVLDNAAFVNVWSAANTAADFKGYYTVSMPRKSVTGGDLFARGAGYATLKMNTAAAIKAGKVAYVGLYPNGKPFSGTATLMAKDWNSEKGFWARGVLPVVSNGSYDSLSGAFQITPGAADPNAVDVDETGAKCLGRCSYQNIRRSVAPASECAAGCIWQHAETFGAMTEATLDVFGTYYNSAENFADCCSSVLSTTKLGFFLLGEFSSGIDDEVLESLGHNLSGIEAGVRSSATVTVAYKKNAQKKYQNYITSSDTKKLPFSFALSTGLASGTITAGGVTFTYKGVVMPGWGSEECTDCGMGGTEAKLRPFISGTAWFDDTIKYTDARGKVRSTTVRRSCPFSVGVNPGE